MQPEGDDQELWEVIVSPDDIKLLTLEQLDDMFRLEVISASTLVRQKGTSGWQRLGVVAGIEEDRAGNVPADWSDSMPAPAPAFGVYPKAAARAPSFAAAAHPFWNAGAATEALPLLDVDAPILTAQVAEPALQPPTFDSLTRAEPLYAPAVPYMAPARAYAPRRSPLASTLVLLTAIAGALWALHRNDVLRTGAGRLGLEPKYVAFEKTSLGKPGFGTPRALEAFLVEIGDAPDTASPAPNAEAPPPTSVASAPTEKSKTPTPSSDSTKAVSLDALPVLPAKAQTPESAPAPATKAATPAPHAEAAPARKTPAPAGEKITLDETPAKTPAKPQKPENPLQAAIRQAMEKQDKKK